MIGFAEKYLIKTNVWVALCFASLLAFFQLVLYELNLYVLGIVFFGTFAIYNFSRIGNLRNLIYAYQKYKQQIILTMIGLAGTFVFVLLRGFEFKTFLYLFVLGFVSFCYSLPFSGLGLRTIPFLKLFLIAFVWAGSSIGLLLIVHHSLIKYQLLFFSVFFFVIGITIPFDIRDKLTDHTELRTIPQVIGVGASKIFSVFSLVLSGILFYLEFNSINSAFTAWLVAVSVSIILVINSNINKSEHYYSLYMESCSMIPLTLYLFLLLI